ncbi:MAG TPA: replication-relaxation family protein [Ktedonobacterales bacterium]|nr:replication-relaxation family protein [Ktedonobacterales bacterium]
MYESPCTLSAVDEKLLLAVHRFHYLTLSQLVHYLGYSDRSKGSSNWLGGFLKELVAGNYLAAQHLPRVASYGRNPLIYSLSTKGIHHIEALGLTVQTKLTPAEQERSFLFLEHTLKLNDVLIAACLVEKQIAGITLADLQHERVLKHHPTKVQIDGKQVSVIPDAWLDFRLTPPFSKANEQVAICLELDRATEDVWKVRAKIRNYVAFAGGAYQAAFGTSALTIAFVATSGGDRRVQQMKIWTREELRKLNAAAFADLFLFTALDEGAVDGLTLFTSPVFQSLSASGVALLEQ